jgi:hypothetical protein
MYQFTPENITELKENEIFVFGSNTLGNHAGGAARLAAEKFGAIIGKGDGLQGRSYAIPTLNENMQKVKLDYLSEKLELFSDFTKWNSDKLFLVTKIGLGIAGFTVEELKPLFDAIYFPDNVILPEEFKRPIKGVKAFNPGMRCLGFQYSENTEFKENSSPVACKLGFHFCENPLDTLSYYPDLTNNEYAEVEALGTIDMDSDKVSTNHIRIGAKLQLSGFIKAIIYFIFKRIWWANTMPATDSGDDARIGSSGYAAQIGSSGNDARIGSSGNYAQIGSSGNYAQIGSSGNAARIGSSGNYAQIGSSGDDARIGSSGYAARIVLEGECSVASAIGNKAMIKGKIGSWITLAEYDGDGKVLFVKSARIDGVELKEDTFYQLINEEFKKI